MVYEEELRGEDYAATPRSQFGLVMGGKLPRRNCWEALMSDCKACMAIAKLYCY